MNIDHLIETCIPGGDLCDPQVVADNIRRYVEQADPRRSILDELKYSLQEINQSDRDPDAIGCAKYAIRRAMEMLQSVTINVRAASEPSRALPTEPGMYWWRCTGGATWYLVEAAVSSFGDKEIVLQVVVPDDQPGWLGHSDWSVEHGIGQWLPWLPPASPNPPGKLMSVHDGWRVSDCGQYIERVGDGKWIVPVGVGCQMLHEDHGSRCWDRALEGSASVKGVLHRMPWCAGESEVQG